MTAALILEFEGITLTEYEAVNEKLGIDTASGEGDWPDGLVTHVAGLNDSGDLVVMEVWDSRDHQARFMEGRLAQALQEGGVTGGPARITWIDVAAHRVPGG